MTIYDADQLELLYQQAWNYHYFYNDKQLEVLELIEEILQNSSDKNLYIRTNILKADYLLSYGDYENGLPLYQLQYEYNVVNKPDMNIWNGEVTSDIILLWQDQGFGDTIQYARYISQVFAKAPRTFLLVKKELQRFFSRNFPEITVVGKENEFDIPITAYDKYVHYPLSQLPLLFKTTLDTIPNNIPYLTASKQHQNHRIGWCWAGGNGPKSHMPQFKSIPYIWILPLMKELGGVSLQQKDLRAKDFSETAEIINGLDLIITVDTAIAHLAGALGKPVWILLPYKTDWRWLRNRTDSPWYPSAKLFRQPSPGDWASVLKKVHALVRGGELTNKK